QRSPQDCDHDSKAYADAARDKVDEQAYGRSSPAPPASDRRLSGSRSAGPQGFVAAAPRRRVSYEGACTIHAAPRVGARGAEDQRAGGNVPHRVSCPTRGTPSLRSPTEVGQYRTLTSSAPP